ncbi:MAG: hypothetical protein IPJ20_23945 [Flammeovirgaceae bacterium]|nr:hypothetical protein [Flammeovirgaceae bacterium]
MYAPAVLPTYLYYPFLKGLGKKIITAFWGSDIRYWYAFAEEMKSFNVQDEVFPFFEYVSGRSWAVIGIKTHCEDSRKIFHYNHLPTGLRTTTNPTLYEI